MHLSFNTDKSVWLRLFATMVGWNLPRLLSGAGTDVAQPAFAKAQRFLPRLLRELCHGLP
ncbi:hypothetical protein [Methylorubrum extorquens]|uniref:Uncharacterized protein n=1 Tax=Methylorubrum extorquens TaxID=408 RepID=A0AAX3WGB2_METEX|nr:hypothetical protein [Methylorubrum extorquens]WHQ70614.1 hypothetical protein KEC54_03090 [Methylorubrum extorquens]